MGRGRVVTGLGDGGIEGSVGGRVDGAAARVSAAAAIVVGEMTVAVGAGLVDRVGNGTGRKSLPPHPANNAVAMISAGISVRVACRPDQETWLAALRLATPFWAKGRFSRPTSGWVSWPAFAFNLPPASPDSIGNYGEIAKLQRPADCQIRRPTNLDRCGGAPVSSPPLTGEGSAMCNRGQRLQLNQGHGQRTGEG